MEHSRLASSSFLALLLLLSACRTSVVGHYGLDLEETKKCIEKLAATDPELAKLKDQTIKLFEATDLDVSFDEDGKMQSTTVLTSPAGPRTQKANGTWKLDGKQLLIDVDKKLDTTCEVDGKRLRCLRKEVFQELYGSYVLVKK
jgi:hypothetical protein